MVSRGLDTAESEACEVLFRADLCVEVTSHWARETSPVIYGAGAPGACFLPRKIEGSGAPGGAP